MEKVIPTSKLARASVTGSALANMGTQHLKHAVKRPFLSREQIAQDKQQRDEAIVEDLFKRLSQLRGTALKIAQMLSMEARFVPDAFRQEMSKSWHQVPPLGRALVRKLMQQEFDRPAHQVFAAFEHEAFAAASLGQVHAAQDAAGNALAVKLQYPGIDVTIKNDLHMLRGLVKPTPYAAVLLPALAEIEARLKEEVNYQQEADNTEWFRQNLTLPGVVVPKVYRHFSTKRVLTTQRLEGLHLEEWLATKPTQADRNQTAQKLYDIFVHSLYALRAMHTDPNPGNYLFMPNGDIGMIDFGCIRRFSSNFTTVLPNLMQAYIEQNAAQVITCYKQLGMTASMSQKDAEEIYHRLLKPFGDWVARPFMQESFQFKSGDAAHSAGGFQALHELMKHKVFSDLSPEFIFFDRAYFGLYQIFERLGAEVQMQHPWLISARSNL